MSNNKGSLIVDALIALLLISTMVFLLSSAYRIYVIQIDREIERGGLDELVQEATGIYDD